MKKITNYKLQIAKATSFTLFFISHLLFFTSSFAFGDNVERIQKEYEGIQDLQGRFIQRSYIKDLERTEKYEGRFFIKRPLKMRWEYSRPRDEEVVISDTDIWIYKKMQKQAIKGKFSSDTYGQAPIALLSGFGDLKKDFDTTRIKEGVFELNPKGKMGLIKKIILEVNNEGFPIKSFKLIDVYGNTVDVTVKDVRINQGFKDSYFIFKAPPGVEVYELNP
ncbi:MAG: outer membrane lipoprotein chaperone LolA [Nitrospirae bacterium]|nr:outer membrane lipoprotein chaperone LolA [Nitrospirota bacterium]